MRPKWTKLPKCIFYLSLFNWRVVNFYIFLKLSFIYFYYYYLFICFKWRLVSSTQELILLTLSVIRPVSSDETDFIRDCNKMSKGN